jgi:CrcB protein
MAPTEHDVPVVERPRIGGPDDQGVAQPLDRETSCVIAFDGAVDRMCPARCRRAPRAGRAIIRAELTGADLSDDGRVVPIDPALTPRGPAEAELTRTGPAARRRHGRAQPDVLAVVAVGGMIGATARFKLAEAIPIAPGRFPWATFWANMSGSFVLGFLLILLLERFPPTRYLRPFLATGILGAYTTMSTYLVEVAVLIKDGHAETGLLYGVGSLVAGIVLAYGGIITARFTPQRHHHHHKPAPEDRG